MHRSHARPRRGPLPRTARATALAVTLVAAAWQSAAAQQNPQPTANWQLADRFDAESLRPFVFTSSVQPRWINETDSLWYNWRDRDGTRFWLVVPKTRTRRPLFDHEKMAAQLSREARKPYEPHTLPFGNLAFEKNGHAFRFVLDSVRYEYDINAETLKSLGRLSREELLRERQLAGGGGRGGGGRGGGAGFGGPNQNFRNFSPDSMAFVFAREHNLYLVEVRARGDTVAQADTVQISTDGVEHYSFGARDTTAQQQQDDDDDDEGREARQARNRDPRVRANVTWSPDSRAFSVSRNDQRKVKELYLVDALADPRPRLVSYRYAMPGEEDVAQQELWTYRRGEPNVTPLNVNRWKDQRLFDIHWTTGSDKLRLVRRDRLQRNLELIEVDVPTNRITTLLTESVENAYLERQNVRYLKAGGDFVWWSERTGWAHLYLYDHNGNLKQTLTSGSWRVHQLADVDTLRRLVYFQGVGKLEDEDPYYRHLYRVNADGTGLMLLDAGNADHTTSLSPSKRYLVDNASRIDQAPVSVLRDERGAVLMELGKMDLSRLDELGFRMPEKFVVKAADGVTDIYGNMWKPFDFDPAKKYPIIAHVYPGPQTEQVSTSFSPTAVQQRLAQLGFIVIQIGNRGGSPFRSNAYHSYGYYNLRDYGLADKKAGIEQLATRYPFIDIDRVGIYGHSGGGFMTAAALLLPPYNDFFKVGVSSAGNHDNNVYNQNWSEQHHGLKEVTEQRTTTSAGATGGRDARQDGSADDQAQVPKFEIKVPANHELAANLKGRLLLVHGDMDNNVHPAGTIRLANELIKANKRFDLFIMPGKAHGFADYQPYFTRMMFEYFAEHLLGDYYRSGATMMGK